MSIQVPAKCTRCQEVDTQRRRDVVCFAWCCDTRVTIMSQNVPSLVWLLRLRIFGARPVACFTKQFLCTGCRASAVVAEKSAEISVREPCGRRAGKVSTNKRMTIKVYVGWGGGRGSPVSRVLCRWQRGSRGCRGSGSRFMQRASNGAWTVEVGRGRCLPGRCKDG